MRKVKGSITIKPYYNKLFSSLVLTNRKDGLFQTVYKIFEAEYHTAVP